MTGSDALLPHRSSPPSPGVIKAFDFPPVEATTLDNGLEVKVARLTRVPLVTLSVVLSSGEALVADARAGLAVLTGEGLEGGTQSRTGPELAEAFENIGAGLSVSTGWDATSVSVTCLADRADEAASLMAEALLHPSFPDSEISRLRNQRLAAIRQRRMDPGSLADDAAAHFFFSDEVSYHRPLRGSESSVSGLDRKEILDFVSRRYRPSGAGLVVVGDVDPSEAEEMASRALGGWRGAPEKTGEVDARPRTRGRKVVVVNRPGAVQSEIRIGKVGESRSTPRFFPLKVFNTVLGGAFTSRLMLSLREKHGFTYGVRSRFAFRKGAGPFTISMAVATEVTARAVEEAFAQLEQLLREGPKDSEVARARDYMAGIFPLHLETTGQVAARIAELHIYELPPDFFATYRARIREVSTEEALDAGRAVAEPDEMTVLVVGDAETILPPLEELALGPVEVVNDF